MDINDALNDPGLRAVRLKDNEFVLPVATPAGWHNPRWGSQANNGLDTEELNAVSDLPPTTMIGTRPTVTLTFSPKKRAREEAEYVAGLSFWGKLHYRWFGFLPKQAD